MSYPDEIRARAAAYLREAAEHDVDRGALRALADTLEAKPDYGEALQRTAKLLHTFGCVPDCARTPDRWLPNARILLDEVVPLLPQGSSDTNDTSKHWLCVGYKGMESRDLSDASIVVDPKEARSLRENWKVLGPFVLARDEGRQAR